MIDTDIITRNISPIDVGKRLGLQPNRAGFCRCPLHGEKTGSLKLYKEPERGWYCFGCHQGGDVIRLVRVCLNCDFKAAVEWFDAEYSLGLADKKSPSEREEMRKRADQRRMARRKLVEALGIADDLKVTVDAMAVRCMRLIDQTAPKRADEVWDPRYAEALSALSECREMSDRLSWAIDQMESETVKAEDAIRTAEEIRNRLTFRYHTGLFRDETA